MNAYFCVFPVWLSVPVQLDLLWVKVSWWVVSGGGGSAVRGTERVIFVTLR